MEPVSNQTSTLNTAVKLGCTGAAVGATVRGGHAFLIQRNILKNPDVFIKMATGEVARSKGFNTPFFRGTKEAADLANAKLDEYLKKVVEFAKSGKYNFKGIAMSAAKGAVIAGVTWLAIYGLYKVIKKCIGKNTSNVDKA